MTGPGKEFFPGPVSHFFTLKIYHSYRRASMGSSRAALLAG